MKKNHWVYRGEECGSCLVRAKCTKGTIRTVSRDGREDLMEAIRKKLKTPEGKKTYQKRMYTVEQSLEICNGIRGRLF